MYSEVGQNLFRCYPLVWITYYCTFHLEKWQHLLWKQKSRNENEVRSQSQICLHSKCLHWGQLVGCVKGLRHQPQLLRSNGEGTGKHGTLWGRVWTMSSNQIVTLSQEPYGLVKIHFSFLSGPSGWCYTPFPLGKVCVFCPLSTFPICKLLPILVFTEHLGVRIWESSPAECHICGRFHLCQHFSKCFIYINPLDPHKNPVQWAPLWSSSLYRCENC